MSGASIQGTKARRESTAGTVLRPVAQVNTSTAAAELELVPAWRATHELTWCGPAALLGDESAKDTAQFVLADPDLEREHLEARRLIAPGKPRVRVRREDDLRHAADANQTCD